MTETLLRDEDVAFFRTHGWWVSPPILDDAFLASLQYGIRRFEAGERDWMLPLDFGALDADKGPVRQADYLSLQIAEFRDAVRDRTIASIAAGLAGTPQVRLFHDQLVVKPPYDPARTANVGWHTDKAYWSTCSSDNMITAWIAVEDVPLEKGPLAVWDGSHLWPDVERLHTFGSMDLAAAEADFRARGLEPEIVVLPMVRGQVSFHHCRLVHGGSTNRTARPRYGYAIHMQDADNAFVRRPAAERHGHINDLLCGRTPEGDPDYRDPDIFPVLWP